MKFPPDALFPHREEQQPTRTAVTLGPEGFSTQVTLVRPLAAVDTQVHVQVVLLREGVATQVAHERPLISVKRNNKEELKQV